jgi:hypothetical protein
MSEANERPSIERSAGAIEMRAVERWLLLVYMSGKQSKSFPELLDLRLVWDAIVGSWNIDTGIKIEPVPGVEKRQEGFAGYDDVIKLDLTAVQVTKIATMAKEALTSGRLNGAQGLQLLKLYERLDPKHELK